MPPAHPFGDHRERAKKVLHPQQVIETYFLENRHMLLELAAFFDRYDIAVERQGGQAADERKLDALRQSLQVLCDGDGDTPRVERLLALLATV